MVDTQSVAAAIAAYREKFQNPAEAMGENTEMTFSEALGVLQMLQYTAKEEQVLWCYKITLSF